MSSSTPTRRRRIAGERRPLRPGETAAGPDEALAADEPTGVVGDPEAPGATAVPVTADEPAATAAPAAAPAPAPEQNADPDAGKRVRPAVLAALAVAAALLVALAAGPFVPGVGVGAAQEASRQAAVEDARGSAPGAAERAAAAILAYDHRSLEADRDAAARLMTEEYAESYRETFDGTVLENAADLKARVRADVQASGVALAEPDRVEVLLFVNQTTVSTANGGEPQVALNRVMLTMQRAGDGRWLVDDITSY